MGTWAVTSGIAHGLSDHEAHPYVYGRYVNDGQYIVHEASPTSSGNLEWFTAQWGDLSFDEINQAVASLPKAGSDLFFLPFLYGSNAGLEMTCGFTACRRCTPAPICCRRFMKAWSSAI